MPNPLNLWSKVTAGRMAPVERQTCIASKSLDGTGIHIVRMGSGVAADLAATNAVMLANSFGTGVTRPAVTGIVTMPNPTEPFYGKFFGINVTATSSDGSYYSVVGGCLYSNTASINAFQLKASTGTITADASVYAYE